MDDKQEFVRPSLWLVYLRLFRIPNVFTAMADIFMGFLVIRGTLEPLGMFILLLGSSCFLYTAGMVLNDVYDVEQDTKERPHRPIPSGMVSREWAKWLGYEMLLVGVFLAWISGILFYEKWSIDLSDTGVLYRAGIIATILAVCIVSYNRWLKHTLWGPPAMGACRMLNVLLGMSPAYVPSEWFGFHVSRWLIAGGIGLYIVGVTWFARTEAVKSNRRSLLGATCVMLLGILVLGSFSLFDEPAVSQISPIGWWLLLGLLSFSIGRRCLAAVSDPVPRKVQAAVKHAILSLIVLDASVVLAVVGPFGAVCVLALLIPTLLLGRWVYST